MTSPAKPTILLVPGALTGPSCYDPSVSLLEKAGYPTVSVYLPSNNPVDPEAHTARPDGKFLLHEFLAPLLKDGKDVVIFAHSIGATALTGAGRGLTKSERTKTGEKGSLVGIVYISCALAPDGQSQVKYLGGALPPFCKIDTPSPGLFVFDRVIPYPFHEAEPAVAIELAKGHLPHAIRPLNTLVSVPLWTDPALDGRRVYLKTLLDATFPLGAQRNVHRQLRRSVGCGRG